jgi:hypothetical protein
LITAIKYGLCWTRQYYRDKKQRREE